MQDSEISEYVFRGTIGIPMVNIFMDSEGITYKWV